MFSNVKAAAHTTVYWLAVPAIFRCNENLQWKRYSCSDKFVWGLDEKVAIEAHSITF